VIDLSDSECCDRRMHQNVDWSLNSGLECSFDREGLLASGSGDSTIKLWNVA